MENLCNRAHFTLFNEDKTEVLKMLKQAAAKLSCTHNLTSLVFQFLKIKSNSKQNLSLNV